MFEKLAITRAQDAALILYSGLEARFDAYRATVVREILEGNYASQVAVIRIDGTGDASLFRGFLEKGMAHIKTLEVPSTMWPAGPDGSTLSARLWLSAELPRLRNLVAKGWEPPTGAHWLTDLQTLSIKDKPIFGANTLRVFSTCIKLLQSWD
ncbi:hypothetical protein FS837_003593 [Tulasnella sp. UAMH 9824]|nr:hypothetical protein FS837_003593 [Tulasnella sp. UAMH 9824]